MNITSGIVEANDNPQQARSSTYAPSKAALDRTTQSFGAELRGTGIAVNAVAPLAAVRTEGATAMMDLPDHLIEPIDAFVAALEEAFAVAEADPDALVTLGVVPTGPHTGYGYLHQGARLAEFPTARAVAEFVGRARRFVLQLLPTGKYSLRELNARDDFATFLALLTAYRWKQRHNIGQ